MSFFWGKVEWNKWYGRFLGWWEQGRHNFIAVHEMAREVWAEGMVVAVEGMVYFSE